jgi:dGTPase
MRHSLKIASAAELTRLDERLPNAPLLADGTPADGDTDPDPERGRYRAPSQRDRDRLLYCSAFQRLGGVTQVTESESGHTFHTRLTHSLKVAQLARRLTEKLLDDYGDEQGRCGALVRQLDPDASEAAALAHDLGHPPFGHVAEVWLRDHTEASFEGNAQTFRILTALAVRSLDVGGLSLTRRTLNGVLKYPYARESENVEHPERHWKWGAYESDLPAFRWVRRDSPPYERSLTAEIMDWADDVTYAAHDLEDFYRAGLIPLHRLLDAKGAPTREIERFKAGLEAAERPTDPARIQALVDALSFISIDEPYEGRDDQRAALRGSVSSLITQYLKAVKIEPGPNEGRAEFVIEEEARRQVDVLKDLTWVYVVRRPSLAVMQAGRQRIIESLHRWYLDAANGGDGRLFPPAYRTRLHDATNDRAKSRLVNDLLAGLTEGAAHALYRRMSGIEPGSVIDATARVQ